MYKFFQPWPTPNVTASWDAATHMGRVAGVENLTVQLQPVGQAQAWFGRTHGVLWECYFHEAGRKSNWQDELAAIWRIVEHDIGAAKFFTHPHDSAFEEGYQDFLRHLGYSPDPDTPAWWSKPTT